MLIRQYSVPGNWNQSILHTHTLVIVISSFGTFEESCASVCDFYIFNFSYFMKTISQICHLFKFSLRNAES